jgi:hypothetical protein
MNVNRIVTDSDRLADELRAIKRRKRLSLAELGRLVDIKAELLKLNPAARFLWNDGKPVVDLLKEISKLKGDQEC